MKKNVLLLITISFAGFVACAQIETSGKNLLEGLQKWKKENPQEKLFLQSDRDRYAAGDAIWMKAWCYLEGKPSFLSRIIYITLSDDDGNVIEKKMCALNDMSSASAEIDIPKTAKSGNYLLSGYTLWMLNFPEFVFRKHIYIYNSDYRNNAATPGPVSYDLKFFPEGGDMVEGVKSRVAFKVVDSHGLPAHVTGEINNNSGEKITSFSSRHDGMGLFEFFPKPNTVYKAIVNFENGSRREYSLPPIRKEGISLQVNNSPSRLFILVDRGHLNKQNFNKLFVVVQMGGVPVYLANLNLDEGESATSLIKKNLPPGIAQVTVFDSSGTPLAERLAFISNYQVREPVLITREINTGYRKKSRIHFTIDSVLTPEVSVLITDTSASKGIQLADNIASCFLLSSDLKGYVHNPGYYFADRSSSTLENLDLLMMTQGWRRFTWKQVTGNENIVLKYPVETFMNIKGVVTKTDRKEPVTDGFVTLHIRTEDSTTIMANTYLTDKGEFFLDSLQYKNKAVVSYEGTNNRKMQLPVDVKIYPSFIDSLKKLPYQPEINLDSMELVQGSGLFSFHINKSIENLDSSHFKTLGGVTVTTKKISRLDSLQKEYVSPFFEDSDQTLELPENRTFINIWQFLNANVPGFNVNPFEPGGVTQVTFDRYAGISLDDSNSRFVKFLLNEIPVATEVIDGLNPSDVALIKVYKGASAFVFGSDAGAISVYTKKGIPVAVYDKQFFKYDKIGFAYTREFYSPDYDLHPELNKNNKDSRLTLYWDPKIKSSGGLFSFNFSNNDMSGAFKLIIQGIDKNGQFIYLENVLK